MSVSPAFYRVRSINEAAKDLLLIQLRTELEFYKALSLEFGSQLEGLAELVAEGRPLSITIGSKTYAKRRGHKGAK